LGDKFIYRSADGSNNVGLTDPCGITPAKLTAVFFLRTYCTRSLALQAATMPELWLPCTVSNSTCLTLPPSLKVLERPRCFKELKAQRCTALMARNGPAREHPAKVSSSLFHFATIIIHGMFDVLGSAQMHVLY
jgi:hypothetical protein